MDIPGRDVRRRNERHSRDLAPETRNQPGLGVYMDQRMYNPRANSSVPQFLDRLAVFVDEKRREKVGAAADEYMATGETPEGMEDDKLFQNTIAKRTGQREAIQRLHDIEADIEQDLQHALENDSTLDPEVYARERFADLIDRSDNENYREAIFAGIESAQEYVSKIASAAEAKAALEGHRENTKVVVHELYRSEGVSSETIGAAVAQMDAEDFLTRNEIIEIQTDALIDLAQETDDPEEVKKIFGELRGWLEGYDKGAAVRLNEDLRNHERTAVSQAETRANRLTEAQTKARNDLYLGFQEAIIQEDPALSLDDLQEHRDQLGETMYGQLAQGIMRVKHKQSLEAQRDTTQTAIGAELTTLAHGSNPTAFMNTWHLLSPDQQRDSKKILGDQMRANAGNLITATSRASQIALNGTDPLQGPQDVPELGGTVSPDESLFMETSRLIPNIRLFNQIGENPPVITGLLNAVTVDSPNVIGLARVWSTLQGQMKSSDPIPGVSAEAVVQLNLYNELTNKYRYSPQDALDRMRNTPILSATEARRSLSANQRESLDDALDTLTANRGEHKWFGRLNRGDLSNSSYIRSEIQDLALLHYQVSQDPEAAIEWATTRMDATHEPVGNRLVPLSAGIYKGFGDDFAKVRPQVTEYLTESGVELGEDGFDFIVHPVGDGNYQLILTQPMVGGNGVQYLYDSDGNVMGVPVDRVNQIANQRPDVIPQADEALEQGRQRTERRSGDSEIYGNVGMGRDPVADREGAQATRQRLVDLFTRFDDLGVQLGELQSGRTREIPQGRTSVTQQNERELQNAEREPSDLNWMPNINIE